MTDMRKAVADALSTALGAEGEMVIKWVVIAETMGDDGERGLWAMASPEMKPWETLGMLEYGRAREYAREYAARDDDE